MGDPAPHFFNPCFFVGLRAVNPEALRMSKQSAKEPESPRPAPSRKSGAPVPDQRKSGAPLPASGTVTPEFRFAGSRAPNYERR
jgi:hypothetical protein